MLRIGGILAAQPAHAIPITWAFSGDVTSIQASSSSRAFRVGFPVGTVVGDELLPTSSSGVVAFDPASARFGSAPYDGPATTECLDSYNAFYRGSMPASIEVTVNRRSMTSVPVVNLNLVPVGMLPFGIESVQFGTSQDQVSAIIYDDLLFDIPRSPTLEICKERVNAALRVKS